MEAHGVELWSLVYNLATTFGASEAIIFGESEAINTARVRSYLVARHCNFAGQRHTSKTSHTEFFLYFYDDSHP